MGIFSWFWPFQSKLEVQSRDIVIDLSGFLCGRSALGETLSEEDTYSKHFAHQDVFVSEEQGLEIGTTENKLAYVFLTIGPFQGTFLYKKSAVIFTQNTTPEEVQKVLGEPYWKDEKEDELILFYEDGRVELQFEFPNKSRLGFVTMMIDPIMAKPEQRKAYGVTKPWPPQ